MQIRISDMMDECCPEMVELGTADAQLTGRIKKNVMDKIKKEGAHTKRKKVIRTVLMVAVIASLMTATAFAAGLFTMNREEVPEGEVISGYWRFYDGEGNLTDEQKLVYPYAGLVFTFTGPDSPRHQLEIKPGWLPEEDHYDQCFRPDYSEDGWGDSFGLMCHCEDIKCQILAEIVEPGNAKHVLNGKPVSIEEEEWDRWKVTKVVIDYTDNRSYKGTSGNYILMFDEETGILVIVRGTDSMETLEKIAKNLEIRETDTLLPSTTNDFPIGCIDMGRG